MAIASCAGYEVRFEPRLSNLPIRLSVLLFATQMLLAPPALAIDTIVAIGASNTSGFGVGEKAAYPARLETLLRGCGLDIRVVNAGISFQTTHGMLARIDSDVPDGTKAVIIQPGGNDRRFFVSRKQRAANIEAMTARLAARGIPALVYDPVFPHEAYQWDRVHLTAERHSLIAAELAPRIAGVVGKGRRVQGCR